MYVILDRYIKKIVLLNIFLVFLILVSLSSIIRLIEGLRNFERIHCSIYEVLFYIFLSLPKDFELFLTISTLLGGLLGLAILEMRNELVIMQIFGLSNLQIGLSVIKVSVFILLFNLFTNEWLLPYSQDIIYSYDNDKRNNFYLFSESNKNLWLTDSDSFISIENMLKDNYLLGVNIYYFTTNNKIKKIMYLEQVIYTQSHWMASNVIELDFSDNNFIINKHYVSYEWKTTFTPDLLSMITIHPRVLSISNLFFCIKYFLNVGQNAKYYQLVFWNKIFSPIVGIIMLFIALLYSFGPLHRKKISVRLFFGSIVSFVFYILYQILGLLSIIYSISPIIGSVLPIILFFIINMVILWSNGRLFRN